MSRACPSSQWVAVMPDVHWGIGATVGSMIPTVGAIIPAAIETTGFAPGPHSAAPTGRLVLRRRDELMLWHYRHLGFERTATREASHAADSGPLTSRGATPITITHYSRERLRAFWDEMEAQSANLSTECFEPDRAYAGPLWWRYRPDIARTVAASEV